MEDSNVEVITNKSTDLVKNAPEGIDYDKYIDILTHLNERQLKNIIVNIHTRFDKTLTSDAGETDWGKMSDEAKKKFEETPENLRCLLGCPMVVLRYKEFTEYLKEIKDLSKAKPSEVFWGFTERFPVKTYFRAVRVKPGDDISFYSRMLVAPKLFPKFMDYGTSSYPPVVGDFEEWFSYHVYANRSTGGSLVSWTEKEGVAIYAATEGVEKYDPDWHSNKMGRVFVMRVEANSFFFLDETEVNRSSEHPVGRESVLVMSLPFRSIEKGGMAYQIYDKAGAAKKAQPD